MALLREQVTACGLVKLAAMECFASSVMTYLRMAGKDDYRFLLDYWSIRYQFRTLLFSKDVKQMDPEFMSGTRLRFVKGDDAVLYDCITSGLSAVFLCTASKLPYFPRSMLGLESSGFQHSILICGWDEAARQYLVADPMVDYIGWVSQQELVNAGSRMEARKEVLFFALEDEEADSYEEMNPYRLFAYAAERNLRLYSQHASASDTMPAGASGQGKSKEASWMEWLGNRNGGVRAYNMFAQDAVTSLSVHENKRNSWIDRNCLTIGSAIAIRRMVWSSFRRLGVLTADQDRDGEERLEQVLKQWRNMHFKLLKYKRASKHEQEQVEAIIRNSKQIQLEELSMLQWMSEIGQSVEEGSFQS